MYVVIVHDPKNQLRIFLQRTGNRHQYVRSRGYENSRIPFRVTAGHEEVLQIYLQKKSLRTVGLYKAARQTNHMDIAEVMFIFGFLPWVLLP